MNNKLLLVHSLIFPEVTENSLFGTINKKLIKLNFSNLITYNIIIIDTFNGILIQIYTNF